MGQSGFPFGILIVLIGLAAAAFLIVVAIVWWRRTGRRQAAVMPLCGKCGYCVRGVPTFTCPECGADLREVGIVGPHGRRRWSTWLPVLVWTVLLPFPATLLTPMVAKVVPQERRPIVCRDIDCYSTDQPDVLLAKIHVCVEGRYWAWPWSAARPQYDNMVVYLFEPVWAELRVDLRTATCCRARSNGQGQFKLPRPFDVDVLLAWFAFAGLECDSGLAGQTAIDIFAAIEETPRSAGKTMSSSPDPQTGVGRVVAGTGRRVRADVLGFGGRLGDHRHICVLVPGLAVGDTPDCAPAATTAIGDRWLSQYRCESANIAPGVCEKNTPGYVAPGLREEKGVRNLFL